MRETRLAFKIFKTIAKEQLHYSGRLVVDTVGIVARCGILLILYWYVFKLNHGVINGTTFLYAAWSMLLYFSFSLLRLRDISRAIMQDIQSGNIEILFSKPISYLSYRIWWQIGSGTYSFVVISILAIISLAFAIGLPPTVAVGIFIPSLILTFGCGVILSLYLYAVVGLLSFWIEDINPVYWIVDKAVMILGGSYLPVALFPAFMYKIALYSPFGASQFITHTVYKTWAGDWQLLIGIQLFWIIFLGLIVYFMFEKAKQKVSVNGG